MPITRTTTGLLPKKAVPQDTVVVEKPAKKRVVRKSATKSAPKKKDSKYIYISEDEAEVENEDEEEDIPVLAEAPGPVYETGTADLNLKDGLYIVRNLGGGKIEVVNLTTVNQAAFSSEEMGRHIKSVPERLALVDMNEDMWKEVKLKCHQATQSANLRIFRFQKLPKELRYRVYDFTLLAKNTIQTFPIPDKNLGFALLRTCRQIYNEGSPFFYRNSFRNPDIFKGLSLSWQVLSQNIQDVTIDWYGFALKDPKIFKALKDLPKLKTLNIVITRFVYDVTLGNAKKQRSYQEDKSIEKFSRSNGFDAMVDIRGLEKVTVSNKHRDVAHRDYDCTQAELDAFEKFLMKTLTKPKPQPPIKARARQSKRVKAA